MTLEFPIIPQKVKINTVSDFDSQTYEDELGQKRTVNKVKPKEGKLPSVKAQIDFTIVEEWLVIQRITDFYLRVKSQNNFFSLPEDFFRNINDSQLLVSLFNLFGNTWVFNSPPSVQTIVSGLYQLNGKLETLNTDTKQFTASSEIRVSTLELTFTTRPSLSFGGTQLVEILSSLPLTFTVTDLRIDNDKEPLVSQSDVNIITQLGDDILV